MYFSFVIDVYSRMIVGWQLASHMRTDLVLDALRMALATRQPGADFTLVAHTDQGSQYVSEDYTQQLDDARVLASVGSVGDAYDNAMAESFVDLFKTELIKDRVWHSNTKLELAIVEWVAWFNTRRLHSSMGTGRPPSTKRRRAGSPHNRKRSPPVTLFTLNAAGEYDPSGVVSELPCQTKLADNR